LGPGVEASPLVVGQTTSGRVTVGAVGFADTTGEEEGEDAGADDGATGKDELETDAHPDIRTASANGATRANSNEDLRPMRKVCARKTLTDVKK
jgi:hypothetical protein